MSAQTQPSSRGIGFLGLLAILFIGLKLTGHIAWSWWWVLAPTWIWLAFVLVALLGLGFLWLGALCLDWWLSRKRKKRVVR